MNVPVRVPVRVPGLVAGLLCVVGCVTTPVHRPIGPPLGDHYVEAGIGPHAEFGKDSMGVGASAWAAGQIQPGIDIVGHGYSTDFFPYATPASPFADVLFGGGLGIRGRYAFFDTLLIGAEGFAEYDQRTGAGHQEQLFAGIFGIPVAEKAFDTVWVYTDLQLGIAIPLTKDPQGRPFFGIQEIPIGVAWEVTPWFVLVGEGGYALALDGGYGSVAAAFRF